MSRRARARAAAARPRTLVRWRGFFCPPAPAQSFSSRAPPLSTPTDPLPKKPPQLTSSALDTKLRDDLERLKKIRNHRGLRHYWGLRVKGQHTKTTGRRGKTVGVAKKR